MKFFGRKPRPSSRARIKSNRKPHAWEITGGYDPEQDGNNRRYVRYEVTCPRCGEVRRVGAPFHEFVLIAAFGCARTGFDSRYRPGDMVTVSGRLDYFVNYLPDGKAATANAGGGTYVENVADLEPYLPKES